MNTVPLVTVLPQERVPPLTWHKPIIQRGDVSSRNSVEVRVHTFRGRESETTGDGRNSISSTGLCRPSTGCQQTAGLGAGRSDADNGSLAWDRSARL